MLCPNKSLYLTLCSCSLFCFQLKKLILSVLTTILIQSLLKSNTKFFYEQTMKVNLQTIIKYLGLFHNTFSCYRNT